MRTLLLLVLSSFACSGFGQATSSKDPIGTARPSFSDTPQIVPLGHLQLEAGASAFSKGDSGPSHSDLGEALLRYGLTSRAELRLGLPNYNLGGHGASDGFDNTSVAASFYLGQFLGCDLGIIPAVAFPTGAREVRDEIVTPSFLLNAQRGLGGGSSLATTLGQSYGEARGSRVTQSEATLVYVRPLRRAVTGFIEYAGFFDPLDRPTQFAHVGLQLLTTKTTQIDVHGGVGLGGPASRAFIGAGYSIRF